MGASETTLVELFIMSKNEALRCTATRPHLHTPAPPPRCTPAPLHCTPSQSSHHHCPAQTIAAGKEKWEGRSDASLIDYLDEELTSEYKHLQAPHLQAPQP